MCTKDQHTRLESADATMISYTLLRHLGLMLDELSAQGLTLWQDKGQRWCWAWAETAFHSERPFWSIGEAIVDAVVSRFPAAFDRRSGRSGGRRRRSVRPTHYGGASASD